jgi:hypothetical protein
VIYAQHETVGWTTFGVAFVAAAAVVAVFGAGCAKTLNRNGDQMVTRNVAACVQAGGQWVAGNCVRNK